MPRIAKLTPKKDQKSGRFFISIPPIMSETGKRRRLFFDSERQANAEANRRIRDLKRHGYTGTSLPADLATEAARCAEMLAPWNATLTEAVAAFVAMREAQERSVTVAEAWKAYIADKDSHSDRYRQTLRYVEGKIPEKLRDRLICDLSRADVKAACEANGTTPTPFNDAKRLWHGVFAFSIREGWAKDNLAKTIPNKRKENTPPSILTVEQSAKLLRAAEPCEAPAVALLLFAGVRPDELKRLEWSDVDLSSRNLRIPDAKSKTVTGRNIHLEDAAIEWLKRCKDRTGLIIPANWKRRISRIRKAAGLTAKDQDICRHTFGSMWLAANEDTATLQNLMGHSHVSTYLRHYHRAIPKRVAISFWKLTPDFVFRKSSPDSPILKVA